MVMQAEYKVRRQRATIKTIKAALENSPMDEHLLQKYQNANVVLKNLKQVAKTIYQDYDMHSAFIIVNGDKTLRTFI